MFQPHYFRGGMVWRDAPGLRRHKEYQDGFLTTSGELPLQSAAALQTNNNTLCLESFIALTLMLWCINIIVLENVTDVARLRGQKQMITNRQISRCLWWNDNRIFLLFFFFLRPDDVAVNRVISKTNSQSRLMADQYECSWCHFSVAVTLHHNSSVIVPWLKYWIFS